MTQPRLKYLYQRFITHTSTNEELAEFEAFLHAEKDSADLASLMDETWDGLPNNENDHNADHIYKHIINQPQQVKRIHYPWLKIAASVLFFISAGLLIHHFYPGSKFEPSAVRVQQSVSILPGGNKAILTLNNGKKVELNDNIKGEVAIQNNTTVNKVAGGQLVYATSQVDQKNTPIALNTLTVPSGGLYNIVLSDGTRVSLNSASSLTYPTSFTGDDREVTLTGEAYFEVAKNAAKPFKVNVAGKQQVQVLGTHFNIMAYQNDDHIKTTLLEGSIKLSSNGYQSILKPGQIAVQDLITSAVTVKYGDVDEAVAWKNGYFKFHHEDIRSIMKKVARWYNIDVAYTGNITTHTFAGIYLRNRELSELLKGLEYTGLVHFKTEGRRITVMP